MLFDRNPIYTRLADKIKVRDYVIEKIVHTIWFLSLTPILHPDEIDIINFLHVCTQM